MTEKDMKPFEALIAKEAEADNNRRRAEADVAAWTRARDQYRGALALAMGDADTGVIDGRVVLRRVTSAQFAKAQFAKKHPALWEEVRVAKLTYEVDVEKLKGIDEDLYNEFCTRRWYNDIEEQ